MRSGRRSSSTTSPKARAASRSSSGRARGSARRTLAERLRALEAEGILERQSYAETPPRVEYRLTAKGEALLPIIDAMREFGHEWLECGRPHPHDL